MDKMKYLKRLTPALLALLIAATAFTACSNNDSNETDAPIETDSGETLGEDEEIKYANLIEAVDYKGWTLNIANDAIGSEWFNGFTVEDMIGEAFNDAIYERNSRVKEKFNIKIVENNSGSYSQIKNAVSAGVQDVGFGYVLHRNCMSLVVSNYIRPINAMPVFDLSKPYWDKGAQETMYIADMLWHGYNSIGFDFYEGMAVLFYNGYLLEDSGIEESPADLYYEGKWTLEAMYDMMQTVSNDVNGDGEMKQEDDVFGFAGRELEYLPCLYSSGASLLLYNETDHTYEMNVTDELVMQVGDWVRKTILDTTISYPGWTDYSRTMFKEGRVLFYSKLLGDFRNLRDKEDDYGIICWPSVEEGGIHHIYVQNPMAILIPSNVDNAGRLATVIEALAADSYDNVMEPYIEKALIGRGTRDAESAKLFREFCDMRVYDMSYALGEMGAVNAYYAGVETGNYASSQKRLSKSFSSSLKKTMEALEEISANYKDMGY